MNFRRPALLVLPLAAALGLMLLPTPSTADKHLSARMVADILDGIIQPLFADDSGKVFGVDRVTPVVKGHGIILPDSMESPLVGQIWSPKSHIENRVKQIDTKNCRYFVGLFHIAHVPGKPVDYNPADLNKNPIFLVQKKASLTPLATSSRDDFPVLAHGHDAIGLRYLKSRQALDTSKFSPEEKKWFTKEDRLIRMAERENLPLVQRWEQTAKAFLESLQHGTPVSVDQGKWTVFMRPINANKPSCVSCHHGATLGDTLGVMVYAVSTNR